MTTPTTNAATSGTVRADVRHCCPHCGSFRDHRMRSEEKVRMHGWEHIQRGYDCAFCGKHFYRKAGGPVPNMAMARVSRDGEPLLFVRDIGGDETPPAQGKFCSSDGRMAPRLAEGGVP